MCAMGKKSHRPKTPDHLRDPNAVQDPDALADPSVVPTGVVVVSGTHTKEKIAARKAKFIADKAEKIRKNAEVARAALALSQLQPTSLQRDELKQRIGQCWNNVKIYEHYSVLWNLPEKTIQRWLAKIFADWVADDEATGKTISKKKVLEQVQHFIDYCYVKAEGPDGNPELLKSVPHALDKLARIVGAYETQAHSVQVTGGIQVGEMSEDAMKNRIAELIEKHGHNLPGSPANGKQSR